MISIILYISALMLAGALLLSLAWRWPQLLAGAAISITVLLDCFQIGNNGADLGVNLYADDAAAAVLLLTALLTLARHRKSLPRDAIPCAALLALAALNFTRGVSVFGIKAAGNSARNLLMFAAPALTIMVLRPAMSMSSHRLARWFGWAGCVFCAIAVLRWAGTLPMPVQLEDDLREVARALPSDYAIVIGQAFIAVIYLQISGRTARWWWAIAGMLGTVTIFLQHRSVWVATALGLGWLAVRTARRSTARWFVLAGAGAIAIGAILVANPGTVETVDSLVSANIQEARGTRSTWEWRVQGFTEATRRVFEGATTDMIIGPPGGWAASSGASFASVHIHDRYVDTLAFYGLFGLAMLLVWLGALTKRVSQARRPTATNPVCDEGASALLQALLLSEVVYLIPYFGGIPQGAVLGLIWVAASRRTPSQRARRVAHVRAVSASAKEPAVA